MEKCEHCFTLLNNLYYRKSCSKINTSFFYCKKCDIIYESKLKKRERTVIK